MSVMLVEISKIRRDGGTQSRAELDQNVVNDYTEKMKAGATFPPVKLFYDGQDYWLADGFHRVEATIQFGSSMIKADVHQGSQRAAILDSVGANANHGLRRSRDDTRRAISTLLNDPEWGKWSDREIAKRVDCDHKTVGKVRAEMIPSGEIPQTRMVERGGTVYEMKPAAPPQSAPKEQTTIVNSVGVTFHLGDCIRVAAMREPDRFGVISKIEGDEAIVDSLICRPRAGTPINGMRVSRLQLFAASDNQFLYWYRSIRLSTYEIALFPYEDHFLAFNSYTTDFGGVLAGFNWHPNEKWDAGVAWRIHRSYLEYWRLKGVSVGLATYDYGGQVEARLRPLISRAGKSRGGDMNRLPQPEAVQPIAPEASPTPEQIQFKVGDLVAHMRYAEVNGVSMPRTNIGMVTQIDGAEITIAQAIYDPFYPADQQETLVIQASKLRIALFRERIRWFCWNYRPKTKEFTRNPDTMVLFQSGDDLFLFNTSFGEQYTDILKSPFNVGTQGKGDFIPAWRIHQSFVRYWQEQGHTAVIVPYSDLVPAVKEVVWLADRTYPWGELNVAPTASTAQPAAPAASTPEPTQKTVIKVGMKVLTRTGRVGEVLDIIGGIANVKSGSYTNPHKVDTLKPMTAPSPAAKPIWKEDQLNALKGSVRNLTTFLELRQIPQGNLFDDIEVVYQAVRAAREEYYKLLDPVTGEVKQA